MTGKTGKPDKEDGKGAVGSGVDALAALKAISVYDPAEIDRLADEPVDWAWDQIAPRGGTILIAGGPGGGKTTLLFLLTTALAAAAPVELLGRRVNPAPPGQYVVLVEAEHSPRSAARKMRKSRQLLGVAATDRLLCVSRETVIVGDGKWQLIKKLALEGKIAHIALDTIASTTQEDANSEQEQIKLFGKFKALQRAAPPNIHLTFWILAHTRKDGDGEGKDVSGSIQRTGQCDTVILCQPRKNADTRAVTSIQIVFDKTREEPDEELEPIRYKITPTNKIVIVSGAPAGSGKRRIIEYIEECSPTEGHTVKSISNALGCFKPLIKSTLEEMLAAGRLTAVEKVSGNGIPYRTFFRSESNEITQTPYPPPPKGGENGEGMDESSADVIPINSRR